MTPQPTILADANTNVGPLLSRRLADRILMAFHQACDQRDLEIAEALMACCETVLERASGQGGQRRFQHQELAPGYVRLWKMRAPEGYMTQPGHELVRPSGT